MQKGFQLIELMIVIMIIGILSLATYPAINQHFLTAYRLQAQHALLNLANKLEQYELSNSNDNSITLSTLGVAEYTENHRYHLKLEFNEGSYLLIATPQNNDECGILTLNYKGEKMATSKECWN